MNLYARLVAFGLLILVTVSATPAENSNSRATYRSEAEQTVTGIIDSIGGQPNELAPIGTHLILRTSSRKIDVQLGPARRGRRNLDVLQPGDSVQVTGCMIRFKGQEVLLARIVKRGDRTFVFRNQAGVPVAPTLGGRSRGASRKP